MQRSLVPFPGTGMNVRLLMTGDDEVRGETENLLPGNSRLPPASIKALTRRFIGLAWPFGCTSLPPLTSSALGIPAITRYLADVRPRGDLVGDLEWWERARQGRWAASAVNNAYLYRRLYDANGA